MAADIKRRTFELYGDSPSGKMGPVRVSVPADMVRRTLDGEKGPEIIVLDFFYDGNINHLTLDTVLSPREVDRLAPMYDTHEKAEQFGLNNQFQLDIQIRFNDVAMLFRPGLDRYLGTDPLGKYYVYELLHGEPTFFQPIDDLEVVRDCPFGATTYKCNFKITLEKHVTVQLIAPGRLMDEWKILKHLVVDLVVLDK